MFSPQIQVSKDKVCKSSKAKVYWSLKENPKARQTVIQGKEVREERGKKPDLSVDMEHSNVAEGSLVEEGIKKV